MAAALGVPLRVDPRLAKRVQVAIDWYTEIGHPLDPEAVEAMMRIATVPEGCEVTMVRTWLAGVHLRIDGGPRTEGGSAVVMLPGPPGHLRAVVDEMVVPAVLDGGADPLAVAEVVHDYPETMLIGPLRTIRQRHPTVKAGSYPGLPMIIRFVGDRVEVDAAAAELRKVLADLDANPSTGRVRDGWKQADTWNTG